jgi:predicted protein tyrosine phosphatase
MMTNLCSKNRFANADNRFQNFDKYPRLLTVCSAGLLRSPTAAFVLSQEPYSYNTRSCGLDFDFALIPIDAVLLEWAEIVVVMSLKQRVVVEELLEEWGISEDKKVLNFEIADSYDYRDPELIELIKEKANYFGLDG